jgi:hypothetical protein
MVPLDEGDLARLGVVSPDPDTAGPETATTMPTSRIVVNCITRGQALQINGPIGEEGWKEVVKLEIRDCIAEDRSIQVSHAISAETFIQLLASRNAGLQ